MTSPAEEEESSKNEESPKDAVKPFLGHLEDLRTTLVCSFAALGVGIVVAIPLARPILNLLKRPLVKAGQDPEVLLRTLEVAGGFNIAMRIVFWSALIFSAPFIIFFVGRFVFPGLTKKERRGILHSSGFAVLLFIGGVCNGYFIILRLALEVMFRINTWIGVPAGPIMITNYVTFCLRLLLGFGLAFELPVLLVLLGHLGIVSSKLLREKRAHVIVALLVLAMILTPPDIFTQLLMAGPLILLYEASIGILRLKERRAQRNEQGDS